MAVAPVRINTGRLGGGVGGADILPSQSLYCNNLNDQIQINDLTANLYELFCQYGDILDIVVQKGKTKRGQAFVVFRDISCATSALRNLQGKQFLSKPMRIQYSKTKSDAISKLDGTFKMTKPGLKQRNGEKPNEKGNNTAARPKRPADGKLFTVCVENLPMQINKQALEILFGQYPGFLECRLIAGRAVAFVDFDTEAHAEVSIQGLQGFRVTPENAIKVDWAKQTEQNEETSNDAKNSR